MKAALGKGLGALIPDAKKQGSATGGPGIAEIELARIVAGREQPRKHFDEHALSELAESIRERGVIQPVLLRREEGGSFSLIAGERRFRASKLAGKKTIPAIIREAGPQESLELALIENIQRENLDPIETAAGLERLMHAFGLTQEALSKKVGMERATVANYLRLMGLPDKVKVLVAEGKLTMGHARAVLSIEGDRERTEAAARIYHDGMNVREAERYCARLKKARKKDGAGEAGDKTGAAHTLEVMDLERKLISSLGTKVRLRHKGRKGHIEIDYYSLEELDRLLEILL